MQWFECDYAEGAHPRVLKALVDSNALSTPGYGEDAFCARAKARLRSEMQCEDCEIFLPWAAHRPISWPLHSCFARTRA